MTNTVRYSDWEAQLRSLGCEPEEGIRPLRTADWWRCPWGARLSVPAEADGNMDVWALHRLADDITKMTPPGWSLPTRMRRIKP